MSLEQLMGRYFRLRQELSIAYVEHPWRADHIDRLAGDLTKTEREIAAHQRAVIPVLGSIHPHEVVGGIGRELHVAQAG